jgi:hypothetical protein
MVASFAYKKVGIFLVAILIVAQNPSSKTVKVMPKIAKPHVADSKKCKMLCRVLKTAR